MGRGVQWKVPRLAPLPGSRSLDILEETPPLLPQDPSAMSETGPAARPTNDLAGRTLGNYRLLHRLGRGGMAEVYLAEQPSLQRQVAVKVLRQDLALQPDYVRRFHNEARAVAALVHANIVQIYEVGCVDGIHFIAQEYVPGQNLKQLVTRSGPLEVSRVVSVLRQMSAALTKAAQRNIVHRDIKPENILLSPGGEVKVADFGLARVMDPQNVDLTQAGLTMGTPLYMSPEQVEGRVLDHRSDLYACGVTAFFMLVGRPPFQGDTPLSVAIQHLQSVPPDLRALRPDVPALLDHIITRLLAKKPNDRFASAAELLRELRTLPLDGFEEDLPLEDESLPLTGSRSTLDATRELQAVMLTQAMTRVRRPQWWRVPLLSVLAVGIGAAIAMFTWSGPLLSETADDGPEVDKKSTAHRQYLDAMFLVTNDDRRVEEAFQSVERYFPPDQNPANAYYVYRAQQQLAWMYFQKNRLDEALTVYQKLAALPAAEQPQFRVLGQAGLIIVYAKMGRDAEARQFVSDVIPDRSQLPDEMDRELSQVVEKLTLQGT
jgi:serine/threonine-protein kinase